MVTIGVSFNVWAGDKGFLGGSMGRRIGEGGVFREGAWL